MTSDTAPAQENAQAKSGLKPWQPGQSGNPAGRKPGSRNKLSEAFVTALAADFEQHGATVIETVRLTSPADYLKVIARLVPKEFSLVPGSELADWGSQELADALTELRSRIGGASND